MCTVEAGIHCELKVCWINFINEVKSYGFFFTNMSYLVITTTYDEKTMIAKITNFIPLSID